MSAESGVSVCTYCDKKIYKISSSMKKYHDSNVLRGQQPFKGVVHLRNVPESRTWYRRCYRLCFLDSSHILIPLRFCLSRFKGILWLLAFSNLPVYQEFEVENVKWCKENLKLIFTVKIKIPSTFMIFILKLCMMSGSTLFIT